MNTILKNLVGLFLVFQASTLFAYPGESIVLDANGDYIITYWNGTNMMKTKFVPATKIDPTVNSLFKMADSALITYRYTIINSKNARQPITQISIGGISKIHSNQPLVSLSSVTTTVSALAAFQSLQAPVVRPNLWNGLAIPDPDNSSLVQAGWNFPTGRKVSNSHIGIHPGSKQHDFGFSSTDLPGIGKIVMWGKSGIQQGYEDEGPDDGDSEIASQLNQIERNNFISRNAAAPMVAVPTPFDAAVLIERIQAQMHTWITMQLLDATLSSQLDRYLTAAANAYRLNQPKAGKEHIQTLRKMLKKEHEDADKDDDKDDGKHEGKNDDKTKQLRIDRLAARVLDFDLKYVLKRVGVDKDD